ncbi:10518_t:CDS:2, partial [Scutellospora calospora]
SSDRRPSRRHQHSDSIGEDKFRNGPQVTILKRPQSATDFEHDYQLTSAVAADYSKERRRSDASISKRKCSQRRKDIKSISGILQVIEPSFNNYQLPDSSNKESD